MRKNGMLQISIGRFNGPRPQNKSIAYHFTPEERFALVPGGAIVEVFYDFLAKRFEVALAILQLCDDPRFGRRQPKYAETTTALQQLVIVKHCFGSL